VPPCGVSDAVVDNLELGDSARTVDLVVTGAELVATMDGDRRELAGGWVAVDGGLVAAVGDGAGAPPPARRTLDASGCVVTPGLVNTHHHIYQNLTRAFRPAVNGSLFEWLSALYPRWARLDEEASYVSAWVGIAELALGGCTTTTDHLYVHPAGGGDLVSAEIEAAAELGMRFHPTRGSMSLSQKDGGLPPDSVVQDDDEILADSERLVARHHDPGWGAMVRVGLAPCSPFSVTPRLMQATAELAERLDVRLHTHLAEDADEDRFAAEAFGRRTIDQFEAVGWMTDRAWVAHCIYPNDAEVRRLGGAPVGLGCDGSSSTDSASLWMEARNALLLGRLRSGPASTGARDALEIATLGSAACLGRAGEIGVLEPGSAGDLVCWPLDGVAFAGALSDPIEAWLRCGPVAARHTVVAGRALVEDGRLTVPGEEAILARHRQIAARLQA
jgi:8-oxoguanine deaminase